MPFTIGSLGPQGTNSELAANHYINNFSLKQSQIKLYDTVPEGMVALVAKEIDAYLICSIYKGLDELFFRFADKIKMADCFILDTYKLVLAKKSSNLFDAKYSKVAVVPATTALLEHYKSLFSEETVYIPASSTSISAEMCFTNKVDLCATNYKAAKKYKLNIIKNFGSISMNWTVFKRL